MSATIDNAEVVPCSAAVSGSQKSSFFCEEQIGEHDILQNSWVSQPLQKKVRGRCTNEDMVVIPFFHQ